MAVGILREVGALVEKKSIVESREFIMIIFLSLVMPLNWR